MPRIEALEDGEDEIEGGSSVYTHPSHQSIEDYLKTIYLLAREESPVSTSRLAEARDVKPGSVTGMVKRLADLNLVAYTKHKGASLTPSGEKIALEVLRHHRLIETYLIEALGFSWDEVHEQADILEHYISEKLEERIAAALEHPTVDPHGAPIPSKEGVMPNQLTVPLTSLKPGDRTVVIRIISDEDGDLLRYLADRQLRPGTMVEMIASEPFDGPLTVLLNNEETIIGFQVASAVLVDIPTPE